jgi:FtsP/CotA-like multicopper oxidase with cupredoxin domain
MTIRAGARPSTTAGERVADRTLRGALPAADMRCLSSSSPSALLREDEILSIEKTTAIISIFVATCASSASGQVPLAPTTLCKYVDPLPKPARIVAKSPHNNFTLTVSEFEQKLHRDMPPTTVWGYNGSYPGPTIEAFRDVPIAVTYENDLFAPTLLDRLPVDQTLDWADPFGLAPNDDPYFGPVPVVTHLHGGETQSSSDGNPEAWFTPFTAWDTPDFDPVGPKFNSFTSQYLNTQQATTLWYHDHALGVTRLNVWAGLAGFYLLRDPENEPANLPSGEFEREIVIQDRLFDTDGQLRYPVDPPNPDIHPFWTPEAFGDTIVVNGKIWPFLDVQPRKYRFRLLNGSNARFYNLKISDNRPFIQIGTDGGYLDRPVVVNQLLLAPGERADVIVDFRGLSPRTQLLLQNDAPAPFPMGDAPDPNTTAQILKFRVVSLKKVDKSKVPTLLRPNDPIVRLTGAPVVRTRTLTLNEVLTATGPVGLFLDGKPYDAAATEKPLEGTTEIWEIVNLTGDTHPIHLHLVQLQLLNRQRFDVLDYLSLYDAVNPLMPVAQHFTVQVSPFVIAAPQPPAPNEAGWKDTLRMNPGEVTRFLVRFAPQDVPAPRIDGEFPFSPETGPGYVWHCHILEHEDNDMMRPLLVRALH